MISEIHAIDVHPHFGDYHRAENFEPTSGSRPLSNYETTRSKRTIEQHQAIKEAVPQYTPSPLACTAAGLILPRRPATLRFFANSIGKLS